MSFEEHSNGEATHEARLSKLEAQMNGEGDRDGLLTEHARMQKALFQFFEKMETDFAELKSDLKSVIAMIKKPEQP